MVFVIGSVYVIDYVYWFAYVELALHSRDEATLILVDKLFDVLLDSICQYFIEDFHIDVHQGYWPEIFFFCCVSARLWYQNDAGLIKWVREESLIFNFRNSFSRNDTNSSLYPWENLAVNPSGHGLVLGGRLFITTLISELIIGLVRDSISPRFILGRLYVSRNLSISSRFSSLCAQRCL